MEKVLNKCTEEDLINVEKVEEILKGYGFSDNDIKLLDGYAEGHDLMIVFADNEIKLEDTQDPGDFWAVGVPDIIAWTAEANEDILHEEEKKDEPNQEKINSLIKDMEQLNHLHELITKNKNNIAI